MADCGWGQTVGHLEGSTCVCNATYRDDETVFKMNNCGIPWPIETTLCVVWSAWCFVEMVWHLPKLQKYARIAAKSWWGTLEDLADGLSIENEAEAGKVAAHLTFMPVALFSLFVGLRSSGAMDTFVPYRVMRGVLELWLALVTHSSISNPSVPFTAFTTANAVLITVTTVLSAIEHLETEHAMWWGIAQTIAEWLAIWWFRIELKRAKSVNQPKYDRAPTYGVTPEEIPAYLVGLQTIRTIGYFIAVIVYNASVTRPLFIVWIVTQNAFLYELFLASDYRARASLVETNEYGHHKPLIDYQQPKTNPFVKTPVKKQKASRIGPEEIIALDLSAQEQSQIRKNRAVEQSQKRINRAIELQIESEANEDRAKLAARKEQEAKEDATRRQKEETRAERMRQIIETRRREEAERRAEAERIAALNEEEARKERALNAMRR